MRATAGIAMAMLLVCVSFARSDGVEVYGAEPNPTGDPIGGGAGYSRIVTDGDYTVATVDELLQALTAAQPGEVVCVAPDAEIDLGDRTDVTVPEGVTLAGNRGQDGSPGPLLFGSALPNHRSMLLAAADSRITGLRIRGRDCNFAEINYDEVERSWTDAILVTGANAEVDNCEISNVHHAGVDVKAGSCHIHHNHIHDVHAYPVVVVGGAWPPPLIEANLIYWVWHSIAGSGNPGTGYEARYNVIVGGDIPASWDRRHHCFDMHAYRPVEQAKHELIAGDLIIIHHNTVREMSGALGGHIRGIPRDLCVIHHNWFEAEDIAQAIHQVAPTCNLWAYQNAHGSEKTVVPISDQTTARVAFHSPPPPAKELPVVTGALALDFDVELMAGLALRSVVVELGGERIYEAATAPEPGTIAIDTAALPNGEQKLKVVVTDDRGVISTYPRFIDVQN